MLQSSYQDTEQAKIEVLHESFTNLHHHILSYWSPSNFAPSEQEPLQLRLLQNSIYIEALADFNLLEWVGGRDGSGICYLLDCNRCRIGKFCKWTALHSACRYYQEAFRGEEPHIGASTQYPTHSVLGRVGFILLHPLWNLR